MANPSHNKAIGAVAENYAQALYDVAQKHGITEQVVGDVRDLASLVAAQPDFAGLLAHRTIDTARRDGTLRKLFTGKVHDSVLKFLLLLNRKRRLDQISAICRALDLLSKQGRNEIDVQVISARPLSGEQIDNVARRLTAVLKKTAIVHPHTDPALIGGLKIRIEDRVIDGSVASKLRRLARQMALDGVESLRKNASKVLETSPA